MTLHWAVVESLALPEVAGVPRNVAKGMGSFPARIPVFQHSSIWGFKRNMQMWREAVAEGWPQNRSWSLQGRCQVGMQGAGNIWAVSGSCCAESGSVPLCISVLRSCCLLHVLLCSSSALCVFLTSFPASWSRFCEARGKRCGRQEQEEC